MSVSLFARDLDGSLSRSDADEDNTNLIGTCIGCIFYGFLALLYFQCAKLHLFTPQRSKYTWASLLYATTIFTAGTVGIASYISSLDRTLIEFRGSYQKDASYPYLPPFPTSVVALASFTVVIWLQDALLLYRFLYIWAWNWYLVVFPGLMYSANIGLSLINLVWLAKRPTNVPWIPISTSFWSLSMAFNLILTLSIAARLLFLRRQIRKIIGPQHSDIYSSVSAILVESAALYSLMAILFLVICNINDNLIAAVLPSVEMLSAFATMLIQYRLASRRDTSKESVKTLSQMAFQSSVAGGVRVSVVLESSTTDLPMTGSSLSDSMQWRIKDYQKSNRSTGTG